MRRIFSIVLLSVAAAGCSSTATDGDQYSFCHGYIQKGLGEFPVKEVDRNAMWLSWNEVVKVTLIEGKLDESSYQQGRDSFGQQLAANDITAMQDMVDDECDQGENSTWRWW